jgi:hypothetical protein
MTHAGRIVKVKAASEWLSLSVPPPLVLSRVPNTLTHIATEEMLH